MHGKIDILIYKIYQSCHHSRIARSTRKIDLAGDIIHISSMTEQYESMVKYRNTMLKVLIFQNGIDH